MVDISKLTSFPFVRMCQIDGRRVLKIWQWSFCNFGRCHGKTRGGGENSPPPCQLQVKKTYFEVRHLEVPRIVFQNMLSLALAVLITTNNYTAKNNGIASTFCYCQSSYAQDNHFVEFFLLHILVFFACFRFASKLHMLGAFENWPFLPEIAWHCVIKGHFL